MSAPNQELQEDSYTRNRMLESLLVALPFGRAVPQKRAEYPTRQGILASSEQQRNRSQSLLESRGDLQGKR